ncbi:hypothetical protein A134_23060 [Vibrio crassostreae 9CS106]|uniref:Uncharacterized protein n=1 Tax=Vibrio crassostreae 9CS106 TaxID=1191300 RepID=A0A1B1C388_9VIBR|nr:hypothetical protein A134_23060 [Vibrio crassostreae 9CS106]
MTTKSETIQNTVERIVKTEVIHNASSLVSDLCGMSHQVEGYEYHDELYGLQQTVDKEAAAESYINCDNLDADEVVSTLLYGLEAQSLADFEAVVIKHIEDNCKSMNAQELEDQFYSVNNMIDVDLLNKSQMIETIEHDLKQEDNHSNIREYFNNQEENKKESLYIELKNTLINLIQGDESQLDELISDHNIEPEYMEVLEHWIVSDWLGSQLSARGEAVQEIHGLTIWGRTCSGQSIELDSIITDISTAINGYE